MPDFRKWILALASVSLLAGVASAQVGGGGTTANPFTCTATNGAVTPTLRAEGYTELTGDIVLVCTGGANSPLGSVVPTANITVFLNTAVTSRLLGTNSVTGASEALLLVDEPGSGEGGYGPTVPQIVCGAPQSGAQNPQPAGVVNGCPQFVGNSNIVGGTGVAVASNPNTGVGGAFNPAALNPGANVFQGIVSGNQVQFFGIPVQPPVSSGAERVYRITNIRANANGVTAGGPTPGAVTASLSISSSTSIPITNSTLTVGFVQQGLSPSSALRNTSNTGGSGGAALAQCNSLATGFGVGIVQFIENFPTAFKTQYGPNPNNQNVPGVIYNSESGFIQRGVTGTVSATGFTYAAGQADYGTRLKATFSNVPTGVSVFVSTRDIVNSFIAPSGSPVAVLVVGENASSISGVPAVNQSATTGGTSAAGVPIAPVAVSNNGGTATWEILSTNPSALDTVSFGVYLSYTAAAANNTPAPGSIGVNLSFAPTPSGGQFSATSGAAASATLTIPRFSDSLNIARNLATISTCTTALLYPYVTNINGFDTGMVIANTNTDPFGTAAQVGTCTINFYSAPTATATFTTPSIVSGSVYANLASTMDSGFNGYAIAICNFQNAHGFAFISDVGARNLAMGYLALVFTTRNQSGENLNN